MLNFMKLRYLYFAISLVFLVPGIFSLIRYGLRPGIDFTGGSLLEVVVLDPAKADQFSYEKVHALAQPVTEISSVQSSGPHQFVMRAPQITNAVKDEMLSLVKAEYGEMQELRFETVGPTLGAELVKKTVIALALAALLITWYVARQFDELKYGVSAILAMLHDTLIVLGVFSLLGHFRGVEVDVLFVTALLTTLSFSVHDTIVVYDRIREFKKKHPRMPLAEVINIAVLQTLSRSLNNSITIIVMLLALALLGGESIRWFSVALLIGAVTGTYSSTFTAAPLLLLWDEVGQKLKKVRTP
jgi:preprotein translocase subunit SecF